MANKTIKISKEDAAKFREGYFAFNPYRYSDDEYQFIKREWIENCIRETEKYLILYKEPYRYSN